MDISDQISSLLNSPDGMDKIRSVAASLFGQAEEESGKSAPTNLPSITPDLLKNADSMGNIMHLITLLKSRPEDNRVSLLLALRPHLSEEKKAKVDKAVSLLKIASLLPILKEQGLLDSIL